jgi:hypothetical protein
MGAVLAAAFVFIVALNIGSRPGLDEARLELKALNDEILQVVPPKNTDVRIDERDHSANAAASCGLIQRTLEDGSQTHETFCSIYMNIGLWDARLSGPEKLAILAHEYGHTAEDNFFMDGIEAEIDADRRATEYLKRLGYSACVMADALEALRAKHPDTTKRINIIRRKHRCK